MSNILESELKHKKRTIDDLVRFIKTNAGNSYKYNLLLGAGCSITSGIRSAKELSEDWLKDIYIAHHPEVKKDNCSLKDAREFLKKEENGYWYNPNHEYSCLFEKRFDLPSQRRSFVEKEVGGKFPSIGYAYLIRLIEKHCFNTIFTTNFDDLLNEAFHLFTDSEYNDDEGRDMMRPIVCAHDSSVKSISVTSERPKIIKLHGDYLFDDIKSTERETESLEENIRSKFVEFCKDFGLIVVGYSGNDRSVMDVINMLLKNDDYLKNGLYWCVRKDDDLSDELRKLLWKERVYYVYIDGFDELFAELYRSISEGDCSPLPISLPHKNELIINRLVQNEKLQKSESPIIKDEIEHLNKEIKKYSLFNNMKAIMLPDGENKDFQGYSFEETSILFEIDSLAEAKQYEDALSKTTEHLKDDNLSYEFKEQLLRNAARFSKRLDKMEDAINYCNKLINLNPNKINSYYFKDGILTKLSDRNDNMRECIEKNKYCYECYETLTDLELTLLSKTYTKEDNRDDIQLHLMEDLKTGLIINPHLENECFQTHFSFLSTYRTTIRQDWLNVCRNDILAKAQAQNPDHPLCFYYRRKLIKIDSPSDQAKKEGFEDLWKELSEKVEFNFDRYIASIIPLLEDVTPDQDKIDFIKAQFEKNKERLRKSARFQRELSNFYSVRCGEFSKAQKIVCNIPDDKINMDDLLALRFYGEMLGDCSIAKKTMQRVKSDFSIAQQHKIDHILAEMDGDFEKSLRALDMMDNYSRCQYDNFTDRVYTLLELKEYKKAYDLSNQMLNDITDPNDRQACDLINYEIARKFTDKNIRPAVLNSIISSTNNSTNTKVAANLLLGNFEEAKKLISKDIPFDYDSLHYYENTLVFNLLKNDDIKRILENAHQKVK